MKKIYIYFTILFQFINFIIFGIEYKFDNHNLIQQRYVRKIYFFLLRDNISLYAIINKLLDVFLGFFLLFFFILSNIASMKDYIYPDIETTFATNLFFFIPIFFSLIFFMLVWCSFFFNDNISISRKESTSFFIVCFSYIVFSFFSGFIPTLQVVSPYTIFFNNFIFAFLAFFCLFYFFFVWFFYALLYHVIILWYVLYRVAKVVIKFKNLKKF